MIPEDIMTGLQSLAASENMNDRQRTLMTEAAAIIKFQQHRVSEAERLKDEAHHKCKQIFMLNEALNIRTAHAEATTELFRKHLTLLADMQLTAEDYMEQQKRLHPPLVVDIDHPIKPGEVKYYDR